MAGCMEAEMREEPVPCINATDYEIGLGKHLTWEDDRHCNPCRRTLERFAEIGSRVSIEVVPEMSEEEARSVDEYASWNTGVCARCGGEGILGSRVDAHPSVYGMACPDCNGETS